jgi:hypothetical protein
MKTDLMIHAVKKQAIAIALFLLFTVSSATLQAQVAIGSNKTPEKFSVLELISNAKGLRLPQMDTAQRDQMTNSSDFQAQKTGLARGLMIYNTATNCVEFWNGTKWVGLC